MTSIAKKLAYKYRVTAKKTPDLKLVRIKADRDKLIDKIKKETGWSVAKIANEMFELGLGDLDTVRVEDLVTDVVLAKIGGELVGYGVFIAGEYASKVWVDTRWRRIGVATAMYDLMDKQGKRKLQIHPQANENAQAFWAHRKKRK